MFLEYVRRVNCRSCGVRMETSMGVRQGHADDGLRAVSGTLRKLSWKETAASFHTTWDKVHQAVEYIQISYCGLVP